MGRLKDVRLIKVQFKHLCNVLSWSVSLKYQLVRRYDVSNRLVLFTYQWDVAKTPQSGPLYWHSRCDVMMMSGVLCSTFFRCLRWFRKMLVSLRDQLWHLCNVLSWSISLRYYLVRCYDASNRLILFKYQWDVTNTFQIGPFHWPTSCNVVMTF